MTEADTFHAERVLRAAQAQGVLPAGATLPAGHAGRPWPVVLLTALGAWLAAVPLIGVVGLLLGDFIASGPASYAIGILLLAGAVTVLRSRGLPVFVEQLAVPALLTGGGTLAFGLGRDLSPRGTAACLAVVMLALAAGIPRSWLRTLLGALAGTLTVFMLQPSGGAPADLWGALHLALLPGLATWVAQDSWLAQARRAHAAAVLEPIATGWLAVLLVGLAAWSGMTLLAGGVLGPGLGAGWGQATAMGRGRLVSLVMPAASVLLALAAGRLVARDWPTLWQPLVALAGAILILLSWFMPALGAVLLTLAAAATTHRWRLATLAALAAAWIVGAFYYQLHWTLGTKALVLTLAGVALGVLAWIAHRRQRAPLGQGLPLQRVPLLWIASAGIAALAVANHGIWQKERLIAQGQPLFVQLAPVDPRSLMQGDYMRLAFALPAGADTLPPPLSAERPFVVARRDARGVARLLRFARAGEALAPGELRIELTPRDGSWTLASDAWFFGEGDAHRWQAARFGEFRVDPDGRALLVGLADAQLRSITVSP